MHGDVPGRLHDPVTTVGSDDSVPPPRCRPTAQAAHQSSGGSMITLRSKTLATLVASVLVIAALSGCATKKFVRQESAANRGYTDTQVTAVRGDLDQVRTQTDA